MKNPDQLASPVDVLAPPGPADIHLSHPKYRPDIDGLRTVAVMSVIFFHAFPGLLKGGFVGVDIFFVISGFLISTVIYGSLARNSFSFAEFYGRRVRRIFPALLLVLVSSLVFAHHVLLADEYTQFGKHVAAGAGFVSNLVLWGESGYFDTAAEVKPLLHLWSLGIEEQFYILWPLMLWLTWRYGFNLLTVTVLVALVSFTLNAWQYQSDGVAVFFSPQTRFWELLAGSMLAYVKLHYIRWPFRLQERMDTWLGRIIYAKPPEADGRTYRDVQSALGGGLVVLGLVVISKDWHHPGFWAIAPVLGAVLIIAAGREAWLNRIVLSNRLMVWIGLISYPTYLWHWPLLSFARIIESGTPSIGVRVAAVIVSIVLAWLTYLLVERPLRFGGGGRPKAIGLAALMVVVGLVGWGVHKRPGADGREVVAINSLMNSGADGGDGGKAVQGCGLKSSADEKLFANCLHDSRDVAKFALLGDSKAAALYAGLVRTSSEHSRWLFVGGAGNNIASPVPVLTDEAYWRSNQKPLTVALVALGENSDIETVVLVTATRSLFQFSNSLQSLDDLPNSKSYGAARDGLGRAVGRLVAAGKRVVLMVDNPTLLDPHDCVRRSTALPVVNALLSREMPAGCSISLERHFQLTKQYRDLLAGVEATFPGKVKVFDPLKLLCDEMAGVCLPVRGGRLMYSYSDHISDYAAGLIGRELNGFVASAW